MAHDVGQRWVVPSEAALQTLAAALAHKLMAGDVYLLYGEVGAGKTTFRHVFRVCTSICESCSWSSGVVALAEVLGHGSVLTGQTCRSLCLCMDPCLLDVG